MVWMYFIFVLELDGISFFFSFLWESFMYLLESCKDFIDVFGKELKIDII